ncbi:unnamed protein product, partial [Gulo gulo]
GAPHGLAGAHGPGGAPPPQRRPRTPYPRALQSKGWAWAGALLPLGRRGALSRAATPPLQGARRAPCWWASCCGCPQPPPRRFGSGGW